MKFVKRLSTSVCLAASLLLAPGAGAGDGAEIYNELLEKGLVYPDQEWQDYVQQVGDRLLEATPHRGRTYTFVVVDNPRVNAMAEHDQYIFVDRGILALFNSEDELAGVLGHEIGHVVGRHEKRLESRQRAGNLLAWLGLFATSSGGIHSLTNNLNSVSLLEYKREYELEADELGTVYTIKSGYSPWALIESIQQLRDYQAYSQSIFNRPTIYHGIFGSHPAHNKRLHEMVQQSQHLFPDELVEPIRDYHQMVDGLVYGDEAATGIVKDGVYYHGAFRLRVAFPKDWDVQSTSGEVFGTPPRGGDPAAISLRRQNPPEEPQTPQEYLTETLRRDDLENGEDLMVGPYRGHIASIKVASGDAQLRKIAIVYKDGEVYLFNGELGASGDPEMFEQAFRETVLSLRAMTAADLRLVNTQKIRVVEAKPGDTYAELAKGVPLKAHAEETLRLLNGHYPRGEPRAGDLIKIIR